MYLVHNIHFVFPGLRSKTNLFYQCPDIVYRVVAGSIQFMNIHRSTCIKGNTAGTGITSFALSCWVGTVDGLGQASGTGGFTHSSWTTKQKSMCQLLIANGILYCGGNMLLPHKCIKVLRTVF